MAECESASVYIPLYPLHSHSPVLVRSSMMPRWQTRAHVCHQALARACRVIAAAAVACALAGQADAQAVRGFGEDATVTPRGVLRIGVFNTWQRTDQTRNGGADTLYESDNLVRPTEVTIDLGLLNRLAIGAVIPYVSTQVVTTSSSLHDGVRGPDTVRTSYRNGLGDVDLEAKLVWLGSPNRHFARELGVHLRSAVSAVVRLGTGSPTDGSDPFAIGTGDGQTDIEFRSQTDLLVGRSFWVSGIVRYTRQLGDNLPVTVGTGTVAVPPVAAPFEAQRQLGDIIEFEATPRLEVGRYLTFGAQYRYTHHATDHYTGTSTVTIGGETVTLDASTLDAGTGFTQHTLTVGISYSTVRPYLEGYGRFPMDITYEHAQVLSISGGLPKMWSDRIGLRYYVRLWGSDFTRTPCGNRKGGCVAVPP